MQEGHFKIGIRSLWTFILVFIAPTISKPQDVQSVANNLMCTSYIFISGESNVNTFEFTWVNENGEDQLDKFEYLTDSPFFKIGVPVRDFKARNSMMFKDFMELMKAKDYPKILIAIPVEQISKVKSGEYLLNPEIIITIAGVSNAYKVPCYVRGCSGNAVHVNGVKKISLTDFGIIPPERLEGLVRVKNEINVDFGFILTFSEPIANNVMH
jgi:hypothetical protein